MTYPVSDVGNDFWVGNCAIVQWEALFLLLRFEFGHLIGRRVEGRRDQALVLVAVSLAMRTKTRVSELGTAACVGEIIVSAVCYNI